jgi:hypothetical protein
MDMTGILMTISLIAFILASIRQGDVQNSPLEPSLILAISLYYMVTLWIIFKFWPVIPLTHNTKVTVKSSLTWSQIVLLAVTVFDKPIKTQRIKIHVIPRQQIFKKRTFSEHLLMDLPISDYDRFCHFVTLWSVILAVCHFIAKGRRP